jgi:addiction module HigA family antidote
MDLSRRKFAQKTEIPHTGLNQIVRENRSITADTALRLSMAFGYHRRVLDQPADTLRPGRDKREIREKD